MKRSSGGVASLVVGIWLASCGGGTLGGGIPTGGSITGGAAGRGIVGGAAGIGGDGVPAGGISGAAGGSGGLSGSVGSGRGGSGFISCTPPPPACGALCGNGKQDSCIRVLTPDCEPQALMEQCDGADFGGDSCATRGYASGKLVCRSDCTLDATGCSACVPNGGPVVRCGAAPVPVAVTNLVGFAIGATDAEVGLATFGYNNFGATLLWFARLTPGLDLLSSVSIEDTSQPVAPNDSTTIYSTAVAPLSSGWVVAGCGDPQVIIHLIDAAGRDVARTVVDRVTGPDYGCVTGTMVLAPRPGGGPLLLWRSGFDLLASLVADDGRSAGPPVKVVGPALFYSDNVSAVWVGDAFYVAAALQRGGGYYRGVLHLARVPPGGAPTGSDILVGEAVYGPPALISDAGDLRVLYEGIPPGGQESLDFAVLWRRLGPSGESLSDPVVVGTYPDNFGPPRAVAFGGDTVVIIGNNNLGGRVALTRLATDGRSVTPIYDLVGSPLYYLAAIDIVRRGPDVVVGWLGVGGTLGLARVMP